jgi:hypothetical protein
VSKPQFDSTTYCCRRRLSSCALVLSRKRSWWRTITALSYQFKQKHEPVFFFFPFEPVGNVFVRLGQEAGNCSAVAVRGQARERRRGESEARRVQEGAQHRTCQMFETRGFTGDRRGAQHSTRLGRRYPRRRCSWFVSCSAFNQQAPFEVVDPPAYCRKETRKTGGAWMRRNEL